MDDTNKRKRGIPRVGNVRPPDGARCATCQETLPRYRWRVVEGEPYCIPCWSKMWTAATVEVNQ